MKRIGEVQMKFKCSNCGKINTKLFSSSEWKDCLDMDVELETLCYEEVTPSIFVICNNCFHEGEMRID